MKASALLLVCDLIAIGMWALFAVGLMLQKKRHPWANTIIVFSAVFMCAPLMIGYSKMNAGYPVIALNAQCTSNLKQVGLAIMMYASENDDLLPLASNWTRAVQPFCRNENIFHCPVEHSKSRFDYALNANLAGGRAPEQNDGPKEMILAGEVRTSVTNPLMRQNTDLAVVHAGKAKGITVSGRTVSFEPGNPNLKPIYWDRNFKNQVSILASQVPPPDPSRVYADMARNLYPYVFLGILGFLMCVALVTARNTSKGKLVFGVSVVACAVLILGALFAPMC